MAHRRPTKRARGPRGALVAAAVLAAGLGLGTAYATPPADTPPPAGDARSDSAPRSLLWDGDAAHGTGVFGTLLCDDPASVDVVNWGDAHGDIFRFNKPTGSSRCEAHTVRTPDSEYEFRNGTTYWFGWDSMTKTGDAQTVFQWKSNGTNDEHSQNYPVLMKVEDGKLKVWYVAPGEEWIPIGQADWSAGTWHSVELGIRTGSAGDGTIDVHVDGTRIAHRTGVRTWDDLGNKPRWGTYWGTDTGTPSINWIDGPTMGTTHADVQR